ncbi:MAG: hypothetical protein IPO21_21670 [Bacteroidales bacterium]|nr:hypothetical protein [Bacteroidales bacterium]
MAEILINNLLNNAINHNLINGSISIEINQKEYLLFQNTGNHIEVNPDTLFLKYVHGGHIAKNLPE